MRNQELERTQALGVFIMMLCFLAVSVFFVKCLKDFALDTQVSQLIEKKLR